MNGTDATTGKKLSGLGHLRQSIRDILTTPIGSRVVRRNYGSRVFDLIDAPLNPSTILDFYAAVAEAIAAWEPRFKLSSVALIDSGIGYVEFDLTGVYLPDGQEITLEGIRVE